MEQRNEMLKQMRLTQRERRGEVQHILSRSFSRRRMLSTESPPREISIPVPQSQLLHPPTRSHSNPGPNLASNVTRPLDTISVGELSIEPHVIGLPQVGVLGTEGRDEPTAEEEEDIPPVVSRQRRDSSSSSDSSCPEALSVRTPLLDEQIGAVSPPIIPRPSSLKRYDDIFRGGSEEEIPLGGTADTLVSQP